jgi:anti-sigma-K factor RskA
LAAGVAAALLIISNIYWISQINQYRRTEEEIITLLTQQRDLLAAAGAGNVQRVQLVSTEDSSAVEATVLYNPTGDLGLLFSDQFPELSPDRAYQLWLLRGEQSPVSAGLFQVDDQGHSVLVFRPSEPIESYDAIAVSTEPASGSEAPTTSPIAVGTLPQQA